MFQEKGGMCPLVEESILLPKLSMCACTYIDMICYPMSPVMGGALSIARFDI